MSKLELDEQCWKRVVDLFASERRAKALVGYTPNATVKAPACLNRLPGILGLVARLDPDDERDQARFLQDCVKRVGKERLALLLLGTEKGVPSDVIAWDRNKPQVPRSLVEPIRTYMLGLREIAGSYPALLVDEAVSGEAERAAALFPDATEGFLKALAADPAALARAEQMSRAERELDQLDEDVTLAIVRTQRHGVIKFIEKHRNFFPTLERAAEKVHERLIALFDRQTFTRLEGNKTIVVHSPLPRLRVNEQEFPAFVAPSHLGSALEAFIRTRCTLEESRGNPYFSRHGRMQKRGWVDRIATDGNRDNDTLDRSRCFIRAGLPLASRAFVLAILVAKSNGKLTANEQSKVPEWGNDDVGVAAAIFDIQKAYHDGREFQKWEQDVQAWARSSLLDTCNSALRQYFAAAVLMPYEPFLRAAKESRYDIERLRDMFGVSYEMAALRLATLNDKKNHGIPWHVIKCDPAGNVIKQYTGSGAIAPSALNGCPRWALYAALQRLNEPVFQVSDQWGPPDASGECDRVRYACVSRTVDGRRDGWSGGPRAWSAIALGCRVEHAKDVKYFDTFTTLKLDTQFKQRAKEPTELPPPPDVKEDLKARVGGLPKPVRIGVSCPTCHWSFCPSRSLPRMVDAPNSPPAPCP